jgi:phosphoglycerate dehydrogenase-like enzyme
MTPRTTKVLFLNRHGDELIDYLQRGLDDPTIELQRPPSDDRADLLAMAGEADVLIGWGSDMELLEAAPNLKLFINPGTGISQHLENFRELRKTREAVLANGHGNSYAVAQHTVALLMALANKVIPHHLKMVTNQPPERPQRSVYFKDITIGLLGYGAINSKVHRFLSGFDVSFAACRRSWTGDDGPHPTAVEKFTGEQLGDFFTACDVVINALPANRFTREMVTMREFRTARRGRAVRERRSRRDRGAGRSLPGAQATHHRRRGDRGVVEATARADRRPARSLPVSLPRTGQPGDVAASRGGQRRRSGKMGRGGREPQTRPRRPNRLPERGGH